MQLQTAVTVLDTPFQSKTLFAGAPDPGKDSPVKPPTPEPKPKHK